MKIRKLIATILAVATLATASIGVSLNVNATPLTGISNEYKLNARSSDTSAMYYTNLVAAVNRNKKISNKREKVFKIALSQVRIMGTYYPGYANYSTEVNGKHNWTGLKLSNNSCTTGNTEYTRWMFNNVLGNKSSRGYPTMDCDWCAIFVSWCMYHADVYTKYSNGKPDYAYRYALTADPRIVVGAKTADEKIENFNFDQSKVIYTPIMTNKLKRQSSIYRYTYVKSNGVNTYNVKSPTSINYRKGGIIFFTYDGGELFSHVGIVINWNKATGWLTYISGNDGGRVRVREIKMNSIDYRGRLVNNTIAAYAEY